MKFNEFQDAVLDGATRSSGLQTLLRLGGRAGRLLADHDRYLSDGLSHDQSRESVARELGDLLVQVAAMAGAHGIDLDEVVHRNVVKIRDRAVRRGRGLLFQVPDGPIDASVYASLAELTDEDAPDGVDPLGLGVPLLGLAGEVGTLLVAQKKEFRDENPQASERDFLVVELGDVLWYAVTAARHSGLSVGEVMGACLVRVAAQRLERACLESLPSNLLVLDDGFTDQERFPRQIVIRFQQRQALGRTVASLGLQAAIPNAFPDGPVVVAGGKTQGFLVGERLGDTLTDNSRRSDNYRFHDAIHLAFLAVMGWSPVMRSLLQVKRRSDKVYADAEDSARAIFAEEGLAAVLAKRSTRFQGFLTEQTVDDESVEMVTTVVEDLEVAQMPPWLWKRSIAQGFVALDALRSGPGGFLLADLDARTLTYSKLAPAPLTRHVG